MGFEAFMYAPFSSVPDDKKRIPQKKMKNVNKEKPKILFAFVLSGISCNVSGPSMDMYDCSILSIDFSVRPAVLMVEGKLGQLQTENGEMISLRYLALGEATTLTAV